MPGLRLVALRHHSLGGAGGKSAGLGKCDVHSGRADVREEPRLRAESKIAPKGASPGISREDYEASWQGRFTPEDLNIHGKRALGMPV